MSSSSSTEHATGSTSSSQFDRDVSFYASLTFVLEPKDKSNVPSTDAVQHVVSKLDLQARTTKDTRSKNFWLHAITKHKFEKLSKLALKRANLGAFTLREVHAGSPEEERVRRHIVKWLASTASASNEIASTGGDSPTSTTVDRSRQHPPTDRSQQDGSLPITKPEPDEAGPSISKATPALEDARPEGMSGRSFTRRRASPRQNTPTVSHPSTSDEPPVPGPSRAALGKRAATGAGLRTQNDALVPESGGQDFPQNHAVERPRKRVRIDLQSNTYKYFEEWDEPESIPSPSNASGETQFAPTINDLPPACLQRILVYSIPDPTSNPAKTYRSALYGLMLVCSKWKNAVESAPSLWSYLSNANPPRMLDACIRRSSGVTITVKFDGSMEYPNRVQSALERFVDKVTPHRLRWRSVSFSDIPPTWKSYLTVARAFNGSAPTLVSAKVTTLHGTPMPFVHSLRFFEGNAQDLRHVTLTGTVPNLSDVRIFATIESLRIVRPIGICPAYLLRMLARNNRLRSLELVEVRPSYARLFQNIETLELSELLYFKLHLLKEDTVEMAQLFTRLRAPKCRRLDLAIDMDHLKHLRLEFNMLDFGMEAFLVELGSWMSHWIVLNRATSVDAWVDNIPDVDPSKSAFRWQYGEVINGSYRGHSADVRLEVENQRTKRVISRWAEDVKLHAELAEAGVRRGVDSGRMESFHSYRGRLMKERESEIPEEHFQPHEFTGIWDIEKQSHP